MPWQADRASDVPIAHVPETNPVRRRTPPRRLTAASAAAAALLGLAPHAGAQAPAAPSSASGGPRIGYTAADATAEATEESRAMGIPSPAQSDSFSQFLSHEPHMA